MKKILFLFFALMFVFMTGVKASTCSDERILELSSLANNVNVSTEWDNRKLDEFEAEENGEISETYYPGFDIVIFNLNDSLNVAITRDETKKTFYGYAKDLAPDGVLYVNAGLATEVRNFTVKIRSNDSNCKNEVLKVVNVQTPMFNLQSQYEACKNNQDFEMCKQFTTTDYSDVSMVAFGTELKKYQEEKAKEEKRVNSIFYKIAVFISKYKWIIIAVLIVIVACVTVYIINRKKSRLV